MVDWIEFCRDWNEGLTARELADKHGVETPTVRNWVSVLRKKGVALAKRRGANKLGIDADEINRNL